MTSKSHPPAPAATAAVLQSDAQPPALDLDLSANGRGGSSSGGGEYTHVLVQPPPIPKSTSLSPSSYASFASSFNDGSSLSTTMVSIDIWPAVITGDLNFLENSIVIMHNDGISSSSSSSDDNKRDFAKGSRIRHNIEVHKRDKNGDTPLLYASIDGRADIVRWLLRHGGNPNDKRLDTHAARLQFRYETPLMRAARFGHVNVVKALLEHEDTYVSEQKHDSGDTALHLAAEAGYSNVVSLLLDSNKCNPEVRNQIGATAISIASNCGQVGVVQTLLRHPIMAANSLVTDHIRRTPLFLAVVGGHKDVIDLLLVEGNANPLDRDINDVFAILVAASSHRRAIVQVLNKWSISMAILCLRELSLFYHLDMSSILDLDEYLGDLELLALS